MPGPVPKPAALRQRRNRVAGAARLREETPRRKRAPRLPRRPGGWHAMTRAWWRDVWHSPMAAEYLQADVHGLLRLAVLVDQFWAEPSKDLAAEIRLQQQAFGLSPIDRRRLQWEVERLEEATAKRKRRAERTQSPAEDPRKVLRIVS